LFSSFFSINLLLNRWVLEAIKLGLEHIRIDSDEPVVIFLFFKNLSYLIIIFLQDTKCFITELYQAIT